MLGFLGLDRELGLGLHHSARKSAVPADLLRSVRNPNPNSRSNPRNPNINSQLTLVPNPNPN